MIQEVDKDIWGAGRVYFNPVNTVGVMGAGVARLMRDSFPFEFQRLYKQRCDRGELVAGESIHEVYFERKDETRFGVVVINIPTKDSWTNKSKIEYIEAGLKLYREADVNKTWVISMPRLGCGLGGLNWEAQVLPIVKETMQPFFDVNIPTRPTNPLNPKDWVVVSNAIVS